MKKSQAEDQVPNESFPKNPICSLNRINHIIIKKTSPNGEVICVFFLN